MAAARRPPAAGRTPRAGSRPGAAVRSGTRPGSAPARGRSTSPEAAARTRRTTRLAILGLIALALVVAVAPTLRVYLHQRAEIRGLESQQVVQQQDVAALQAQANRWNDPAYIEAQARARLQFVKPGQKSYTVTTGPQKAAVAPATGIVAGTTGAAGQSWINGMWESLQKAGATSK
jgi:cell division protein FtsB